MPSYYYRCKNCDQPFTLTLTVVEHDEISESLRAERGVVTPEGRLLHCDICAVADLEPAADPAYAAWPKDS